MTATVSQAAQRVSASQARLKATEAVAMPFMVSAPIQTAWWLRGPLDRERLAALRQGLIDGPLTRRLVAARVPGARPYWSRSGHDYPIAVESAPRPAADAVRWLEERAAVALDLASGRGWDLSATELDNGESLVSLLVSHAITDGQGLFTAIDLAARGDASQTAPEATTPGLARELADAAKYAALLLPGGALLRRTARRAARNTDGGPLAARLPAIVALDGAKLRTSAQEYGGTATGLVTTVVTNLAHALRGRPTGELRVASWVSSRAGAEVGTGNMVDLAEFTLPLAAGARYTDLAEVRTRSKAAYTKAGPPNVLAVGPDAIVSNIGPMPEAMPGALGPARAFATRAWIPSTALLHKPYNHSVRVFVQTTPDTTYLTFQPPLPATTPLAPLVVEEFEQWGLTPEFVW
ncbi:hypothetical protein ACWDSJ_35240 [Nocardia sp. NPDC003482]